MFIIIWPSLSPVISFFSRDYWSARVQPKASREGKKLTDEQLLKYFSNNNRIFVTDICVLKYFMQL